MTYFESIELKTTYAANDGHIVDNFLPLKALLNEGDLFRNDRPKENLTSKYSFQFYAEKSLLIEKQKHLQGEITRQTLGMFISRLRSQLVPFFADDNIRNIDLHRIAEFIAYLQAADIKAITIKQYMGLLKRILSIALADQAIFKLPIFPKLKSKSIPRGSFSCMEYWRLLRTSKILMDRELADDLDWRASAKGVYIKRDTVPREMTWLIRFMVNSFIRPVDVKLIQHKHIEIINRASISYLRLNLPETKNHRGQVVTLQAARQVYEALKKFQTIKGYGGPEDYLFIPEAKDRQSAIQLMSDHFRKILKYSNLYIGQYGQYRTLYSLRHTAITFRLLYGNGIDLITLARNARTSVEMIEKFYSSEMTAEMNIGLLQSRRPNR